ncbi:MAG: cytochrome P450 [Actinobacteria bacterium]|nr:MAG: cytochrome P450 [Actinomycetota bacterium]
MAAADAPTATPAAAATQDQDLHDNPLIGEAPPSPAGPLETPEPIALPPARKLPRFVQTVRFGQRPLSFHLSARRELGDVWSVQLMSRIQTFVMTSHPDHVQSLFTAKPADAPSLTGESPLRPILGPNSVLTTVGDAHMRQRKLLLPPFHGEAVERYAQMISDVAEREIDRWPIGEPFALVPRMQAVTLAVIMGGIFGIEGTPERGSVEGRFYATIRRFTKLAAHPLWQIIELRNLGRLEARGALRRVLEVVDRDLHAVIAKRRAAGADEGSTDILSLLLATRDEDGQPLTDEELRDELLTLVLAGHETTANSLAWTFERMLRTPAAYERLREAVRADGEAATDEIEAAIHEGMRVRPVIPIVVRLVKKPWRLGEYVVPAETAVAMSIVALHHREDVYPEPHSFRPERFLGRKPGTYTWIPFGGGIRRCLGATLAMAEQRVVLHAIMERVDLEAPDPAPEPARQRNVTMIPRYGSRVVVRGKRAA